jgi:hypothetical protein
MIKKIAVLIQKESFRLSFACLSAIYFLFPTNAHLADSYDYAASVKYAENLFAAHHLLYNSFNYLIVFAVRSFFPTVDVMRLMQSTDALFTVLCLILLRQLLLKLNVSKTNANALTLFVGTCFGIMRFACEAETYILPIFASLVSSWFYLKAIQSGKSRYAFYSGVFASLACLFHQIHLFWGIGLFMGFLTTRKFKNLLMFTLPTPLVLVMYSWVLVDYNHTAFSIDHLFHFLAQYYFTDQGKVMIPLLSKLTVTAITFVRTFFQVHGTVLETLRMFRVTYLVVVLTVCLVIWSMIRIVKRFKLNSLHSVSQFEILH